MTHSPLFEIALRVYFEDTDVTGVVYHANYLKYFERARTDWLRSIGFEQQALKEQQGHCFAVASAQVQYRRPARLDDWLTVTVAVAKTGGASIDFQQQIRRSDVLLAEGSFRIASLNAQNFRPARLPQDLLAQITTHARTSNAHAT